MGNAESQGKKYPTGPQLILLSPDIVPKSPRALC